MSRFLITGAAGFIGSHLTNRLVEAGHQVLGVDNLSTGRESNFFRSNLSALEVLDITDRTKFYDLANGFIPDIVVHCAASYSDPNLWHRDVDTNIAGTINAINVARHHNAKLVYFQTALPPISSYAISKIAGEQYIVLSGVPHLIFRLANIYGPRNLSGPVPTFFRRLTAGDGCTVVDTRREMIYIDELVDVVMRGIGSGATGKFDVCSGHSSSIHDIYVAVARALEIDALPGFAPAGDDDVKSMELDRTRALTELDWSPITPLDVGVEWTVDWYREHGVGDTYTHLKMAS